MSISALLPLGRAAFRLCVVSVVPCTWVMINLRSRVSHIFFNRDLKIEVFRHFPRTENVKKSRDRQVCGLRFTFVRLDHAPEVSDIALSFSHPKKITIPRLKKKYDFFELFCSLIIEFYLKKKSDFEDRFSAKIEVSGWVKTNTPHDRSELPPPNLKSEIWAEG